MPRRVLLTPVLVCVVCWMPASAQPGAAAQRLLALLPAVEKNLRENVIPFWLPRTVDRQHGGYTIHHGADGQPLPGGSKAIVTQARTLWLASRNCGSE